MNKVYSILKINFKLILTFIISLIYFTDLFNYFESLSFLKEIFSYLGFFSIIYLLFFLGFKTKKEEKLNQTSVKEIIKEEKSFQDRRNNTL